MLAMNELRLQREIRDVESPMIELYPGFRYTIYLAVDDNTPCLQLSKKIKY